MLWIQTKTEGTIIKVQNEKTSFRNKPLMQITKQKNKRQRTCFSPQCIKLMDFFLQNVTLYFTPLTTALSLEKPVSIISDCINLLRKNSYLSKVADDGTVYHVTKENMQFWHTDFKEHVLHLEELKQQQ